MPFSSFTNPYQNPADVPQKYRKNLQKLFIAQAMQDTYANVKRLRTQTETIVAEAKARVEQMILGEEQVA